MSEGRVRRWPRVAGFVAYWTVDVRCSDDLATGYKVTVALQDGWGKHGEEADEDNARMLLGLKDAAESALQGRSAAKRCRLDAEDARVISAALVEVVKEIMMEKQAGKS